MKDKKMRAIPVVTVRLLIAIARKLGVSEKEIEEDMRKIADGEDPYKAWSKTTDILDCEGRKVGYRIEISNDNGHFIEPILPIGWSTNDCIATPVREIGPVKRLHRYSINKTQINADGKPDFIITSPKGKTGIYISKK